MDDSITTSILDHFDRSITMFREAVEVFPAADWKIADTDYQRPAGVAYHVIETIAFYTGDTPADKFNWGARFSCDWEDPDSTKLPAQHEILGYLDDVWAKGKAWIIAQDLAQPEPLFKWSGQHLLGRMLYLLRHIQHHTAEMSLELKRRGYQCPEWQ